MVSLHNGPLWRFPNAQSSAAPQLHSRHGLDLLRTTSHFHRDVKRLFFLIHVFLHVKTPELCRET